MTIKKLIEELKLLDQKRNILVSSDEEWNTLFKRIMIQQNEETEDYVIFGLSGSEKHD